MSSRGVGYPQNNYHQVKGSIPPPKKTSTFSWCCCITAEDSEPEPEEDISSTIKVVHYGSNDAQNFSTSSTYKVADDEQKSSHNSPPAQFTHLSIPYEFASKKIPPDAQAKVILNKALECKNASKIGLTYAANTTQSEQIRGYNGLAYRCNIVGANQAAVVANIIQLLKTSTYSTLADRFYIIPFSSMVKDGGHIQYSKLDNPVTKTNTDEVEFLVTFLKQKNTHVIVWGTPDNIFPIGGGVAQNYQEYPVESTTLYDHLCDMIRSRCPGLLSD